MKRSLKSKMSVLLLMLTAIGLSISTLHSHHHFHWDHGADAPYAEHCLSVDTTVCPIMGYIFETEVLSDAGSGKAFFNVTGTVRLENLRISNSTMAFNRGRSPPALI
ncbi:MAG TPA: hypothetical protein VK112_06920 [Fodinibius sp.]|nr:hypothetical protein [Fodinibius sp.]